MKTLFIPVKITSEINLRKIQSLKLPSKIAVAYSIQYKEIAEEIKNSLSKSHFITEFIQVLGCSSPSFSKETEAILLISSGKFHAISLALNSGISVYVLDSDSLTKISNEEIEKFKRKKKIAYLKFLNADKVGILVSTKPGQQRFERAISLSKQLKGKKAYIFLSNDINISEFENFSINSWINTACPRMDMDSPVMNLSDLESLV